MPGRTVPSERFVGWVERSETQHFYWPTVMLGFAKASTQPTHTTPIQPL